MTTSAVAAAPSKVVVAVATWAGDITAVADDLGNTYVFDVQLAVSGDRVELWSCDIPAGLPSGTVITVTKGTSGQGIGIGAMSFTGVAGVAEATATLNAASANWSTGAVSNVTADALYVGVCEGEQAASTTSTPTGGGTEVHDAYNPTITMMFTTQYQIVSSVASRALTGTWSLTPANAGRTPAAVAVYAAGTIAAPAQVIAYPYKSMWPRR